MIDPQKIRRILAVRNDRFGEFLLNIPALRALKETFPHARLIAAVDETVLEIAGCVSFINQGIVWSARKHAWFEKFGFITFLREQKIDLAVIFNPTKEMHLMTYLAGVPVRVGYNRKWPFLLTHKWQDRKFLAQKHEVEYNLELVGLVGAKTQDPSLTLALNNPAIGAGLFASKGIKDAAGYIALHPWTSDPVKQWGQDNFCELAKQIIRGMGKKIIVIGGPIESRISRDFFKDLGPGLVDLTGMTSLRELAVLLKKCALLISGDSGPVHLACAVKTPVIALFRSDIQGKGAKRWGPWGQGNVVIEKKSLSDISVGEVFAQAKIVLEAARGES